MDEKIKFSIIIPMYNIQEYIKKCIDSVLEQDYKNYEIIVVSDGATDNSCKIVESIKNKKIKLIKKENGGLSSARNEGLKYITGDYIWFIDGDDYIKPKALRKIYDSIDGVFPDVLCFYHYKVFNDKKVTYIDKINFRKEEYPLINTSACSKVYKKDFYLKNDFKFPEGKIYEDLALIPFIMVKAKKVNLIKEPLYNYVYRKSSIMNSNNKFNPNRDDKFAVIDILYSHFKEANVFEEYREELEYLAIKHLLITYSTEILLYGKEIYYNRCLKVLEKLNSINNDWKSNKYLKKSAITTRIYVKLFRLKQFLLCKLLLKIKR